MTGSAPLILLWKPKTAENIGSSLRTATCYGAELAVVEPRCPLRKKQTRRRVEALATFAKRRPYVVLSSAQALGLMATEECAVVEKAPGSRRLADLDHRTITAYIFGPEEGSVPTHIQAEHWPPVEIPTEGCLNLAAAVATALYSRAAQMVPP